MIVVVIALVVIVSIVAGLLWSIKKLTDGVILGEKTPVPSAGKEEGFSSLRLNDAGQVFDHPSACTVWNRSSTLSYTFETPGIATYPGSSPGNPKCIVNIEGGSTNLLSQGAPVCVPRPSHSDWNNPLIPIEGGAVTDLDNEDVGGIDQCVISLDPNQFDSFAAFDYAVGNAASALASGTVAMTAALKNSTSELDVSANQLVALSQSISNVQNNVQKLSMQIYDQNTANANLKAAFDNQLASTREQEDDYVKSLYAKVASLNASITASNALLAQLNSTIFSDQSTLDRLTAQFSQEQKALQDQKNAAKASDAYVATLQNNYSQTTQAPETGWSSGPSPPPPPPPSTPSLPPPPPPPPTPSLPPPPPTPLARYGDCYGAKAQNDCVTCNDVVNAYIERGWEFNTADFAQC